jgi:hypothetical protein
MRRLSALVSPIYQDRQDSINPLLDRSSVPKLTSIEDNGFRASQTSRVNDL